MKQATTGLLATALIVLLCTCGCSTTIPPPGNSLQGEDPTPGIESRLEGVTWHLVVFHTASGRSEDVLPGTIITAYLDGAGKIHGNAGCNQYTAPYSVSGEILSIGSPAITKKYCASPAGIMVQEVTYVAMLKRVSHSRIDGSLLTLMDKDSTPVLTFSSVKITP